MDIFIIVIASLIGIPIIYFSMKSMVESNHPELKEKEIEKNPLIQELKQNLKELEDEYEGHRRRTLEREQRLNRLFQEELRKGNDTA